ncbi:hypothetical protein [Nocardia sp. CC227C]|uniref:hypothetical protein n=1 Tax=Nocardia sp. CC227C TaxID=3044562 RepID=UPI00278BD23B|nr:hypothetical protein [Nocardia sp. CC227C]
MSASLEWPTPITVGHHVYSSGTRDAHNRVVAVYTPPLDQPGVQVAVIGIETPKSLEPHVTGHTNRVERTAKLFTLPGFKPADRDVIDLPELGQWEVVGIPESSDGNPFGWVPGNTINLRRITG